MKQGSRKGSQGHPPPWFETHCQVVNAEFRFIRHPRAGAEPQSSTRRQKLPQKRKIMRTVATGAHAEEHVERRCEANNCHVPHSKFSNEPEVRAAWKPHSSAKPHERVTDCRHQRVPMRSVTNFANDVGSCVLKVVCHVSGEADGGEGKKLFAKCLGPPPRTER